MEIPCCGFTCPVEATLRLVGGKYKAVILWHLMDAGTLRYHELHRRIPRATDKMLAQQLRELERDGLLRRAVYPVVPPKTEYSLTDFGRSLAPILDEMCRWGEWYRQGHFIVAARYTTSNAIHQMGKLPQGEWKEFLDWLEDFEYEKLALPKPDLVCYLQMDRKVSEQLLDARYQGDASRRDIHERDRAYLEQCRISAEYAAEYWHWNRITCSQDGKALPMEEITQRLWDLVAPLFSQGGDVL